MPFELLEKRSWERFFDQTSSLMMGTQAEIEVVGLDIGDQIEAEWVPAEGVSYDPHDGDLLIHLENLDHRIVSPREIQIDWDGTSIRQFAVIDGEGHKQFVRFRRPVKIPEHIASAAVEHRPA